VSVCHFLDGAKTVIDWSESLPELKRLAKNRVYTTDMMKASLHRLVNRYTPEQSHLVSDLNANDMANYLLSTEKNRDKTTYRRKELYELTRKPDMDLRAPLSMARKLIDKIYDPNRLDLATQRSAAWRMAIVSFLPDELAIPILGKLKAAMDDCKPISDDLLERMAYEADNAMKVPPSWPLKYGRTIGSLPAAAHIQFNSIESGIGQVGHYAPGPMPYSNQYHNLNPSLSLLTDNNIHMQQATLAQQLAQQQAWQQAHLAQQLAAVQTAAPQAQTTDTKTEKEANTEPITAKTAVTPETNYGTCKDDAEPIQLHSIGLDSPSNDIQSKLLKQMELMAVTLDEGLKAAKMLSREGSRMDPGTTSHFTKNSTESKSGMTKDWSRSRDSRSRDRSVPRDPRNGFPYRDRSFSRNRFERDRSLSRDRSSYRYESKKHDSRDRTSTRSESYKRGQISNGRHVSHERQDRDRSRDRGQSSSRGYGHRQQSVSPRRRIEPDRFKSPERQSRRDYPSEQRQRERSFATRQSYPAMKKGVNCSPDYDPLKTKSCSKCPRGGHHEFECYSYDKYNPKLCSTCERFHHFADNCKELEKFPPKSQELNNLESTKNW
jgi:hypothetical protein